MLCKAETGERLISWGSHRATQGGDTFLTQRAFFYLNGIMSGKHSAFMNQMRGRFTDQATSSVSSEIKRESTHVPE